MIGLLVVGLAAAETPSWAPARSVHGGDGGFGLSVAAGDLDCDGWPELVVGDSSATGPEGEDQGRVVVFSGSDSGWDARPSWEKWGSADGRLGETLAVGDLDADGCDELAIGEPGRQDERGALVVFFGGAAGIPLDPPDFSTAGAAPGDVLGRGPLVGADLDGDGVGDLAYGVPGLGADEGLVAIHAGPTPAADTVELWLGEAGEQLGWSIAQVDLDGSGEAWTVVGAPGFDRGRGRVHAVAPGSDGLAEAVLAVGDRYDARFGARLARLGDVDGDGREELGVCAPEQSGVVGQLTVWGLVGDELVIEQLLEGPELGAVYCQAVLGGFDLDADGWPDLAVSLRGHAETWLYYGDGTGFGGPAVVLDGGSGLASLGDWDGDGHADLAVGVAGAGRVDVHLGRPDADQDGVGDEDDCDPEDPAVGAVETWFLDEDGEGFGRTDAGVPTCAPPLAGHSPEPGDCDDTDASVSPGATEEIGDGVDQDCDALELCYVDEDGDGHRAPTATVVPASELSCTEPGLVDAAAPAQDCDDGASSVHPGAREWSDDGVDQDCDGADAVLGDPGGPWRRSCGTAPGSGSRGWLLVLLAAGVAGARRPGWQD